MKYEKPSMEIMKFNAKDIIMASGDMLTTWVGTNNRAAVNIGGVNANPGVKNIFEDALSGE